MAYVDNVSHVLYLFGIFYLVVTAVWLKVQILWMVLQVELIRLSKAVRTLLSTSADEKKYQQFFLYTCNSWQLHYHYYEIVTFEFVSWGTRSPHLWP